jgi:hypothetical protein
VGHVAHKGIRNAYKILVCEPEGKNYFKSRRGWEDIIKIDYKEIVCGDMDWIHLAHKDW